jgi:hypothetical protein
MPPFTKRTNRRLLPLQELRIAGSTRSGLAIVDVAEAVTGAACVDLTQVRRGLSTAHWSRRRIPESVEESRE